MQWPTGWGSFEVDLRNLIEPAGSKNIARLSDFWGQPPPEPRCRKVTNLMDSAEPSSVPKTFQENYIRRDKR